MLGACMHVSVSAQNNADAFCMQLFTFDHKLASIVLLMWYWPQRKQPHPSPLSHLLASGDDASQI